MPNILTARDEMFELLYNAWTASGAATENVDLLFADVDIDAPDSSSSTARIDSYGRVSVQHFGGGKSSLSNDAGSSRYTRVGLITVQIFTPSSEGLRNADRLAQVVVDAYEGVQSPSGVWFRNVRVNEVGRSGAWHQTNVLIDFTYDQTK